jgi:ParB family transcriptional regulator, chromosome partitioning protein
MPILTAKVGTNADQFPDILKMYTHGGDVILDMTYGNGVFWRNVDFAPIYDLYKNDLDKTRGEYHDDFRHTHFPGAMFDMVVLDPPYLYVGGFKTLKRSLDMGYRNDVRALENGIHGKWMVLQMYIDGMQEAMRLLKPKGVLVMKGMDQVESGKVSLFQCLVTPTAEDMGYEVLDLFVIVSQVTPLMRHKHQQHARRNHSYFLLFRKGRA